MTPTTLKRIGADAQTIKRAAFVSATAAEQPTRLLAVMGKQRYGQKGMPKVLRDQMYADYLRLGSIAAIAPIYGRSPQSIWETFNTHGYELKPGAVARCRPAPVIYDGVKYSLSGKGLQMRSTTPPRRNLRTVIWEKAHGPLPKGWDITAKDGNPRNCDLENLLAGPKGEIVRHVYLSRAGRAGESREQTRARKLKVGLDRYYRLRDEYKARGLRCDGRVLKPKPTPAERAEILRQRNLAKYHARAERLAAAGLTSRGGQPVYRPRKKLTAAESAYAALKAEMEQAGPRELPIACGFRDTELNQRFAEAGRANKGNFAKFNLEKAA
jgi:hypothetical protein